MHDWSWRPTLEVKKIIAGCGWILFPTSCCDLTAFALALAKTDDSSAWRMIAASQWVSWCRVASSLTSAKLVYDRRRRVSVWLDVTSNLEDEKGVGALALAMSDGCAGGR